MRILPTLLTGLLVSLFTPVQAANPEQDIMMFGDTTRIGSPFSKDPHVVNFKGRYLMYYSIPPARDKSRPTWNIGIAESRDLIHWNRIGEIEVSADYEKNGFCAPCALVKDGQVNLFYQTYGNGEKDAICHAVSTDGIHFERNPTNPIFSPKKSDWSCGRAIDVEIVPFNNKYFLYFATRDKTHRIQQLGVATAPATGSFDRQNWTQEIDAPILFPKLPWEKRCIEAPSVVCHDGKLYMFYAGAYNNQPQQIGVAVSEDGIRWKRLFDAPFLPNGQAGEWNSSESGHPHIFADNNGRTILFYQGNDNGGRNWLISSKQVFWKDGRPSFPR